MQKQINHDLMQVVRQKALSCITALDAARLCQASPFNSEAREIYAERETMLEVSERIEAINATPLSELEKVYRSASNNDPRKNLAWGRIVVIREIQAKGKAENCKTAKEAYRLMQESEAVSIRVESEIKIYKERYKELENIEAPARAAACNTADGAKALCENSTSGTSARKVYETRWLELHIAGK